jgi:hypothetical protein
MLTVVTAGDEKFRMCLHQYLRTAKRHGLHEKHRFIAFDMGMDPEGRKALEKRFPWCTFRTFQFDDYPPHVRVEAGMYAWKPQTLVCVADEFGEQIMWLDSATIFKGPLDPLIEIMERHGVVSLAGQSPIGRQCEPAVLDALGIPLEVRHLPERVSGVIGFDLGFPVAREILFEWARWACDPALSALFKRTIHTHRWQSVLGGLLFKAQIESRLILTDHEVDISSAHPIRWLTTRNKIKPTFPAWALPLSEWYYDTYKFFDQHAIAFNRWNARRKNRTAHGNETEPQP